MSGYSQRGGLTITWTIENFTHLFGMQHDDRIKSPMFDANSLSWCLVIYPKGIIGTNDDKYINLYYYGFHHDNFDYLYSILDSEGTPLVWKEAKDAKSPVKLVKRDEVFGNRKSAFLPNNTLTIQYRIVKKGEAFSTPESVFVHTRIQDNRHVEKWEISDFFARIPNGQMKNKFRPMTQYNSELEAILVWEDEEKCMLDIRYIKEGNSSIAFSTCKVELLDATGKKILFAESDHLFEHRSPIKLWQFESYITKSMLMCDTNLFVPNGTLTLIFELTLSSGVEFSRMVDSPITATNQVADSVAQSSSSSPSETVDKYLHASSDSTLSRDFGNLYNTGLLSDLNLTVGDTTIPVHTQVLSARSPKFAAMLTADRRRKRNEIEGIEIPDTDVATLRRLVRFMYTDAVPEDLHWKEVSNLYVAAGKYKLKSLRDRCMPFLKSGICVLNVCDYLVLADQHQDAHLKSTLLDFITENASQIIDTEPWKKLEKENPQLTSETFRAMYLKKTDENGCGAEG